MTASRIRTRIPCRRTSGCTSRSFAPDRRSRIFVNGALAAEGGALTYTGPAPTEFHLGLFVNPVSGNEWGKFVVDEVRVSSVARYAADFTPALVFTPDASTLSLWHFEEDAGATTADASGNEPDAALVGGAMRVTADR